MLAALLWVLPSEKDSTASEPRTVRVVQYNLCGAAHACPWNSGRSGRGTSVARLVKETVAFKADVVTVNEVCLTQYAELKRQLSRARWPMDGTYASAQDNVPACGPTGRFGSAVLSRGNVPDGRQDYRRFVHSGGETYVNGGRTVSVRRGLLCAHTRFGGKPLTACTAHTYSRAPEQLREIRDWTDTFPSKVPVVLAGDLNLPPDAPALRCLITRFTEADHAKAGPTADGRKIDYLFARSDHVRSSGAETVKYPESDHSLMRGWFVLTR
ncbi:endonuclease/exonuclease/phosphatase family protein [Streptomyces sp. NPDC046716]|uniref:endonuclease/exonuclease/phosphatase family protein n=1 Tax=Streptomyces sp. NPDC046716 TaxID=3157093 RepID=UPI0033CE1E24